MSVDTKKPKGRKARKCRKGPIKEFRCQFCGAASSLQEWADKAHSVEELLEAMHLKLGINRARTWKNYRHCAEPRL